jgi:hypothetical protein
MKERGISKLTINVILLAIVLILLIALVYYFYFSPKKCNDESCFTSSLARCDKSTYTQDKSSEVIRYDIKGARDWQCEIQVQVQQIKTGPAELRIIEGKNMLCLIPLGSIVDPVRDLKNCHGLLKEEIQDIMIQRLHSQIIENLGQISENKSAI